MLFTPTGIFIIAVIALMLFGPEKLPQMARVIGRFINEFKRAQEAVEQTIKAEMYEASGGLTPKPIEGAQPLGVVSAITSDEEDEEEEE